MKVSLIPLVERGFLHRSDCGMVRMLRTLALPCRSGFDRCHEKVLISTCIKEPFTTTVSLRSNKDKF